MSALKQLTRIMLKLSKSFDQQIAGLPLIGQLFSPKWNIIQSNIDDGFSLLNENGTQNIPNQVAANKIKGKVCLRLTSANGQIRNSRLPAAAASDPISAIALNLDTLSPIPPSDTAFAIQSTSDVDQNGDFTVSVALSSKTKIAQLVEKTAKLGLNVSCIDVANPKHLFDDPTIDLITGKAAKTGVGPTQALGGFCAAILVASFALNIWITQQLEPQLQQYNNQNQSAEFATARLQQADWQKRLSISKSWNVVTMALPDSAWTEAISIDQNQLKLSGKAVNAAALVNSLESSPAVSQVRLAAASIQEDDGRESFDLQAILAAKKDPS